MAEFSVLWVCHANICRSPLAEALFMHRAAERGAASRVEADSAGTWGMDGHKPFHLSVDVATRNGIDLAPFDRVARGLVPNDLERFDHIVVMDRRNLSDMQRLRRISAFGTVAQKQAQIRLLKHLTAPGSKDAASDVADPVQGGPRDFDRAFAEIDAGCRALLDELLGPAVT